MHRTNSHEQVQATAPNDSKPQPNEVVFSLYPGTYATYVPEQLKEEPMSPWYWLFLAAIFLALGWIAWDQEHEKAGSENHLAGILPPR